MICFPPRAGVWMLPPLLGIIGTDLRGLIATKPLYNHHVVSNYVCPGYIIPILIGEIVWNQQLLSNTDL